MQIDPVTREPLHVDFFRVDPNEPIRVTVNIETINELPDELKATNATASLVLREAELECLPGDIPESLRVDLAALTSSQSFHAGDLDLPEGVTLITDTETAILTLNVVGGSREAPEGGETEAMAAEDAAEA